MSKLPIFEIEEKSESFDDWKIWEQENLRVFLKKLLVKYLAFFIIYDNSWMEWDLRVEKYYTLSLT